MKRKTYPGSNNIIKKAIQLQVVKVLLQTNGGYEGGL